MSLRSLHTAVYDALASFPQSAQFSSLAHAQVRNLLADHLTGALYHDGWVQRDEQPEEKAIPAGTTATPDFFEVGHTYAYDASGFTAPELLTVFSVVATTTHPETGKRTAFGWLRAAETEVWSPYAEPADEWPACWTDVTEAGDRS